MCLDPANELLRNKIMSEQYHVHHCVILLASLHSVCLNVGFWKPWKPRKVNQSISGDLNILFAGRKNKL